MQIVIDIPDELYRKIRETNDSLYHDEFVYIFEQIEKYGTPLPKGHGKLIDIDAFRLYAFRKNFEGRLTNEGLAYLNLYLDFQPIILEADKETDNESKGN